MILRFRRRHVQHPRDPLAVWFLDQILRVVAHRENRWFGRCYFTISDLKENIARTKSRHMSWPTFVDILKHPPLRAIEVATHERSADCVASRDFRTLRVSKARVTGFQFIHQFLYLFFEIFIGVTPQNLIFPSLGQFVPICSVHCGIEMLSGDQIAHAGINLLSHFYVEAHWTLSGIGNPPSPTKTNAPQ